MFELILKVKGAQHSIQNLRKYILFIEKTENKFLFSIEIKFYSFFYLQNYFTYNLFKAG